MKIYIAGKITGLDNYKEVFKAAEKKLIKEGHSIMNPSVLPPGFDYDDYMHVCYAMIDTCDGVYFLDNWQDSKGAKLEYAYAESNMKQIRYQVELPY